MPLPLPECICLTDCRHLTLFPPSFSSKRVITNEQTIIGEGGEAPLLSVSPRDVISLHGVSSVGRGVQEPGKCTVIDAEIESEKFEACKTMASSIRNQGGYQLKEKEENHPLATLYVVFASLSSPTTCHRQGFTSSATFVIQMRSRTSKGYQ